MERMQRTEREHWARIARHWARLGPPLRPSADDVAIAARIVDDAAAPRRVLLLGVTPELAALPGAELLAIDRAPSMIGAIFPRGPGRRAVVGDWRALPCAGASVDVVLGDGCLANVRFPDEYRAIAAELARVVRGDGRIALRSFVAPERAESLGAVRDALARGAIAGFHALKWRIAHALAAVDRNVPVADVWRAFEELVPDRAALPWPRAVIDTIDVYRGSPVVYSFPTAGELARAVSGPLVDVACHTGGYELADRCPTLVWRVR